MADDPIRSALIAAGDDVTCTTLKRMIMTDGTLVLDIVKHTADCDECAELWGMFKVQFQAIKKRHAVK